MSQTPSPIYSTITIAPNPCLNNSVSLALITITINDTNIISIDNVTDSDGNIWYENLVI